MPSSKVITEAVNKVFSQRVAFLALRAAQNIATESPDTPNHTARVLYAEKVFRGDEKALLLTLHVVAASPAIAAALESNTHEAVQDDDIESALGAIWDARAAAAAAINGELRIAHKLVEEATQAAERAQNSANEAALARAAMQVKSVE